MSDQDPVYIRAYDAIWPSQFAALAVHEGDLGIKGREAFLWPPGEMRHHLYVLVEDATELQRHLAFRDALRRSPVLREGYAQLKNTLAAQFSCDRKSYTEGKSAFIAAALDACSKPPVLARLL